MDKSSFRFLAFVFGLAGVFLIGWSFIERHTEDILASRGVHVPGEVRSRDFDRDIDPDDNGRIRTKDSISTYYLHVAYIAGQTEYSETFAVTEQAYNTHPTFSRVEVVYDPQNPRVAQLGGGLNTTSSKATRLLGAVVLIVGIACAGWAQKLARDERNEVPDLHEALAKAKRIHSR